MEGIFLVLAIVILLLIINVKNSVGKKLDALDRKLDELSKGMRKAQAEAPVVKKETRSILEDESVEPMLSSKKPVVEQVNEKKDDKAPEIKTPEIKKEEEKVIIPTPIVPPTVSTGRPPVVKTPKPQKPGFFERNPDLEKFIGENLANKIGIGILVLGIGFFVKYAIDQEWIGVIGRVSIGILCGAILLGVAHKLRNTFKAFSSVLVGGGIAVLYLTIAIAFHEYKIFSPGVAFVLMLIITGFTVILSIGYNRMELAILSILGGFASPFMVSTGEGNYVVLFIYVLILDGGMLALAYYKKWNPVNIICYVFTVLLFGTWLGARFDDKDVSMIGGAIIFATLFYLVFFAMNIINNLKQRTPFKALEIGMLLSNTFLYYSAGMVILDNTHGEDFRGLFTALLGVFNFVFAYSLYRSSRVDKNLVFLLIGLVLTFISLAAPVQLKGNYITLFWAAETVLLLWLSQKSGIRLMKLASIIVMILMLFSLMIDWEQIYGGGDQVLNIVFNKGYITGLFGVGAIIATFILLRNEKNEDQEHVQVYKIALTAMGLVVLYTSNLLELQYHLFANGLTYTAQNIIIGCYNMAFILGMLLVADKLSFPSPVRRAFAAWGVLAMLTYLFFYHEQIIDARYNLLEVGAPGSGFWWHYLLVLILLFVAGVSLRRVQLLTDFNKQTRNAYSWLYVFFFVFVASAELDHAVLLTSYDSGDSIYEILTQNHKIGFPILWGLTSFALIAIGLKLKKKHLRIISLTLFLVTLLKLFFIDIRGISEGGKIAAFISLGVLLLIVSFMYQRLKRLLLADEVETKDQV